MTLTKEEQAIDRRFDFERRIKNAADTMNTKAFIFYDESVELSGTWSIIKLRALLNAYLEGK